MIKSYLITDPLYYTSNPFELSQNLLKYAPHVDMALLRDNQTSNYNALALLFCETLKSMGVKPILHSRVKLAHSLQAYGVHLPFGLLSEVKKAKDLGLFVVVSTHSLDEALQAQNEGANAVTYSPIFYTPNKSAPVGLDKLKEISDILTTDIYALGGIIDNLHVELCKEAGVDGFASIRYFIK